jgi:hypothetical protein
LNLILYIRTVYEKPLISRRLFNGSIGRSYGGKGYLFVFNRYFTFPSKIPLNRIDGKKYIRPLPIYEPGEAGGAQVIVGVAVLRFNKTKATKLTGIEVQYARM